jgi:hypothetical protein
VAVHLSGARLALIAFAEATPKRTLERAFPLPMCKENAGRPTVPPLPAGEGGHTWQKLLHGDDNFANLLV